jgi:hypothetical protein
MLQRRRPESPLPVTGDPVCTYHNLHWQISEPRQKACRLPDPGRIGSVRLSKKLSLQRRTARPTARLLSHHAAER